MQLKFDANQQYQLDAIDAVVGLFKGQEEKSGFFENVYSNESTIFGLSIFQNVLGLQNELKLNEETLQENLNLIQRKNNILSEDSIKNKGLNFSIEMETGTGKTYIYLRTAFELNKIYGFKKFIIVVPSVAIREGVLKSIEIMKEHFLKLYNNVPFDYFVYDSKRVAQLRSFASSNEMQIMIINIDSFNKKDNNIIHDLRDQMGGHRPIEFIQATYPIVIMDEPQNMESVKAKEAIDSLNPLCTLRYSATHRDKYNLVYQLDPVKAFQMKLVKKISVNSILAENDPTRAFLKVEDIKNENNKFTVKLAFYEETKGGPKLKRKQFKKGDDLFIISKEREEYRNGFIIDEINSRPGMEYVKFSNGVRLRLTEEQGGNRDNIVKKQIRETIKAHFEKEMQVKGMGIKVLSLFFLDKVENYRIYTADGYQLGKYAMWFEEIYSQVAHEYENFGLDILPVERVHNGYFAMDKKGLFKNTTGNTKDDEDTYSLIMKEKEKLLSFDNPLKFIFSHSALREGWDNPNVFQICTINETVSTIKKRQEIGRGLRLPVDQEGNRVFDEYINNLVVVANESYEEFVSMLQREFEEDCGFVFGRLPLDAFVGICYSKADDEFEINREESETIWDHLKTEGFIGNDGFILPDFSKSIQKDTFKVPEQFATATLDIVTRIEQHQIENHIDNANKKIKGHINEDVILDPEFEKFWNAISTKTVYSVNYSTDELIARASKGIHKMEKITPLKLVSYFADINIEDKGVTATLTSTPNVEYSSRADQLPDILSYIQNKVELTRKTIFEILKQSGRIEEFPVNPQKFMDAVVKEIRDVLHQMIIEGIQYEKLDEISYEMSLLREDENKLNFAKERIIPTKKSVYDYIVCDSGIERKFAEDLEDIKDVKYFVKLPAWFKVPTPIGNYNPDWAILKENGKIVYMIRETKSTTDKLKLRISESDKIECGYKHFIAIGVDYDVATSAQEALITKFT
ncbi:DEAD/DEAH box helicase family protein [Methanosarcina hadiensis]|uniref:restriction endonuclease n=1 Tax=Methanosarcina hadiensis TaxID=3078083 RepID=UPI0039774597